jgi:hypothetical protein
MHRNQFLSIVTLKIFIRAGGIFEKLLHQKTFNPITIKNWPPVFIVQSDENILKNQIKIVIFTKNLKWVDKRIKMVYDINEIIHMCLV